MGRLWQVFVAPGPEDAGLPLAESPWHLERRALLPHEHWELILRFAAGVDAGAAAELESWMRRRNADDQLPASAAELRSMADFLDRTRDAVLHAPPLVPEATEEVPDAYENEEHASMIDAVAAVFREGARLGRPVEAWLD